jgi:hypothetical protein
VSGDELMIPDVNAGLLTLGSASTVVLGRSHPLVSLAHDDNP